MTYQRPALRDSTYRDELGAPIPYGERWGEDGPPEGAYSVVTHPERFAPLHDVADALVDHLVRTYDVVVERTGASDEDATGAVVTVRTVRLVAPDPDAAPLTIHWTDLPGVRVDGGLVSTTLAPACGCDACDESLEGAAEELEGFVLAVAEGRIREEVRGTWTRTACSAPDGRGWSSATDSSQLPADVLAHAERRLSGLPDGWRSWPARATPL